MDVRRDPIAWAGVVLTVLLLLLAFAAGCGLGWLIRSRW